MASWYCVSGWWRSWPIVAQQKIIKEKFSILTYNFQKILYRRNFGCSASLLRVSKAGLNTIIDLFDETFFFAKSFLEMIGKDDKINYLYVKSKTAFKTYFQLLIKVAEKLKLRLLYNFKRFLLINKIFIISFRKFAASLTWHTILTCRM